MMIPVTNTNICEYCDHTFTQKSSLKSHYDKCYKYKDSIIKEKLAEISLLTKNNAKKVKELENKIAELEKTIAYGEGYVEGIKTVKPPKITNNTIIVQKLKDLPVTTIEPFTVSLIKKSLDEYTYEMYLRGELGVVQFITALTILELEDGTVEKNYACSDISRSTFYRLVVGKEWKRDGGARFINTLLNHIAPKVIEHSNTLNQEVKRLDIKNTRKEVLARKECDLLQFRIGVADQKSKNREIILQKIKSSIKNINQIDAITNGDL